MNAIALSSIAFNLARVIGPAFAGVLIATRRARGLLLRSTRRAISR